MLSNTLDILLNFGILIGFNYDDKQENVYAQNLHVSEYISTVILNILVQFQLLVTAYNNWGNCVLF